MADGWLEEPRQVGEEPGVLSPPPPPSMEALESGVFCWVVGHSPLVPLCLVHKIFFLNEDPI